MIANCSSYAFPLFRSQTLLLTMLQLAGTAELRTEHMDVQVAVTKQIIQEEGMRGLWSGVRARVLFHVPAAAISWGVYESMKKLLAA